MSWDNSSFVTYMVEHGIVGFWQEPLTLKSGKKSHFYINWRHASNDVLLMDQLTDYLLDFLSELDQKFDCLFGVPEGASKTALIANYKRALAGKPISVGDYHLPMGRAVSKKHGSPQDKNYIGYPDGKVLVVEDTVTTGGSLIQCIDKLLDDKVDVCGAISLSDRQDRNVDGHSAADLIKKRYDGEIFYTSMAFAQDVVPDAMKQQTVASSLEQAVLKELSIQ